MRLTPPRLARRRMAGLVMPWMLSLRSCAGVSALLQVPWAGRLRAGPLRRLPGRPQGWPGAAAGRGGPPEDLAVALGAALAQALAALAASGHGCCFAGVLEEPERAGMQGASRELGLCSGGRQKRGPPGPTAPSSEGPNLPAQLWPAIQPPPAPAPAPTQPRPAAQPWPAPSRPRASPRAARPPASSWPPRPPASRRPPPAA